MCETILRPRALRRGGGNGFDRPSGRPEGGARSEAAESGDRRELVCRECRMPITRPDLAMEINGSHRHVFFNPHGLVFELGCFASARNVLTHGARTDAFTWFPGYEWQVATCTGCSAQLGWRYTSPDGGFFGLIAAALAEDDGRRA
ncbi:MAG: cereblon family protein [Pseudodesulfovibrio sp.]